MNIRTAFLAAALVPFCLQTVSAENLQRIIEADSPVYDALELLHRERGIALPSASLPWSEDEILLALQDIPVAGLSPAGRRTREAVLAYLSKDPLAVKDSLAFDLSGEANLETYLHTDGDNGRWLYGFEERRPLLELTMELWILDNLYAAGDLAVKKDYFTSGNAFNAGEFTAGDPDILSTGIPTSFDQIDYSFPYRGFLAAGGSHWSVQFGRDTLSWGNGRTGNLLLSDWSDYHDFLRFATFWGGFKMTFLIMSLYPYLTADDRDPAKYDYPDEFAGYKTFLAHRFEFRILRKVRLAVTEGLMYAGRMPDLRLLNPVTVYHNTYEEAYANSIMSLDADWTPFGGLTLYGQIVIDQMQTFYEKSRYDADETPGAMGYLAGAEWSVPLGEGYLSAGLEGAYTDPWLYIRENPAVSFISRRNIVSNYVGRTVLDKPLGYRSGPDAVLLSLASDYRVFGRGRAGMGLTLLGSGEQTLLSPYGEGEDAVTMTSPSGTAEVLLAARLSGEYRLSREPGVRGAWAGADVSLLRVWNEEHVRGDDLVDLQLVLFGSYRF